VSYELAPKPLPHDWSALTETVLLSVNLTSCGRISGHCNVSQNYKSIDPGTLVDRSSLCLIMSTTILMCTFLSNSFNCHVTIPSVYLFSYNKGDVFIAKHRC